MAVVMLWTVKTCLHLEPRSSMRGDILPLPQYVFIAWCLVKHRDNLDIIKNVVPQDVIPSDV
jgi:hypothetical protein